jgi:magnesium-transporting ATPase (P-type)
MARGKPSYSESLTNRVKMIPGDHAVTAKAIAAQINIGNGAVLIVNFAVEVVCRPFALMYRRVSGILDYATEVFRMKQTPAFF